MKRGRSYERGVVAASRRVCVTAARFGLAVSCDGGEEGEAARRAWLSAVGCCALAIDAMLKPGRCCVVMGPSGSGKTTLLRRLACATPRRVVDVGAARFGVSGARGGLGVVELFSLPLDTTVRVLAAAGLAEGPLLVRPARLLSEGERFRVRVALAMSEALRWRARGVEVTLVADEFCALLDDETAASVASGVERWARRSGVRVVVATGRAGLGRFLRPQLAATTCVYEGPEVCHVDEDVSEAACDVASVG